MTQKSFDRINRINQSKPKNERINEPQIVAHNPKYSRESSQKTKINSFINSLFGLVFVQVVIGVMIASQVGYSPLSLLTPAVVRQANIKQLFSKMGLGGLGGLFGGSGNNKNLANSDSNLLKAQAGDFGTSSTTTSSISSQNSSQNPNLVSSSSLVRSSSQNPNSSSVKGISAPQNSSFNISSVSSNSNSFAQNKNSSTNSSLITNSSSNSSSDSSNSSNSSNSSSFVPISTPSQVVVRDGSGLDFKVFVECVDDGDSILDATGKATGERTFSVVFGYTNNVQLSYSNTNYGITAGKTKLNNSRLVPDRPVIHTHFDTTVNSQNSGQNSDQNPAISIPFNSAPANAIGFLYASDDLKKPNTNRSMIVEGRTNETVKWTFGVPMNNSGSTPAYKEFTIGANRDYNKKCPKAEVKVIQPNSTTTFDKVDPKYVLADSSSSSSNIGNSSSSSVTNQNSNSSSNSSSNSTRDVNAPVVAKFGFQKVSDSSANSNSPQNPNETFGYDFFQTINNVDNRYVLATQRDPLLVRNVDANGKPKTNPSTQVDPSDTTMGIKVNFYSIDTVDNSANPANNTIIPGSTQKPNRIGKNWFYDTNTQQIKSAIDGYCLASSVAHTDDSQYKLLVANSDNYLILKKCTTSSTTSLFANTLSVSKDGTQLWSIADNGDSASTFLSQRFQPTVDSMSKSGSQIQSCAVAKWSKNLLGGYEDKWYDGREIKLELGCGNNVVPILDSNATQAQLEAEQKNQMLAGLIPSKTFKILSKLNQNDYNLINNVADKIKADNQAKIEAQSNSNNHSSSANSSNLNNQSLSNQSSQSNPTVKRVPFVRISNFDNQYMLATTDISGIDGTNVNWQTWTNPTAGLVADNSQKSSSSSSNLVSSQNPITVFSSSKNTSVSNSSLVSNQSSNPNPISTLGTFWYYETSSKMIYSDLGYGTSNNRCLAIREAQQSKSFFVIAKCSTTDNRQKWEFVNQQIKPQGQGQNQSQTQSSQVSNQLKTTTTLTNFALPKLCAVAQWSPRKIANSNPTQPSKTTWNDTWFQSRVAMIDGSCSPINSQVFSYGLTSVAGSNSQNNNPTQTLDTNPVITKSFPLISLGSLSNSAGKKWKLDIKDAQNKGLTGKDFTGKDLLNGNELQIWEEVKDNLNQFFAYNTETNEIYYNPNRSQAPDTTKVKINNPLKPVECLVSSGQVSSQVSNIASVTNSSSNSNSVSNQTQTNSQVSNKLSQPTICQSPRIKNLPDTIEVPAFVNDPSQAMKCLTSLAKGSAVTIDQCNGSQTQKWDFTFYNGDINKPSIRNLAQNLCLDAQQEPTNLTNQMFNGRKVVVWDCHWGINQSFQAVEQGKLLSRLESENNNNQANSSNFLTGESLANNWKTNWNKYQPFGTIKTEALCMVSGNGSQCNNNISGGSWSTNNNAPVSQPVSTNQNTTNNPPVNNSSLCMTNTYTNTITCPVKVPTPTPIPAPVSPSPSGSNNQANQNNNGSSNNNTIYKVCEGTKAVEIQNNQKTYLLFLSNQYNPCSTGTYQPNPPVNPPASTNNQNNNSNQANNSNSNSNQANNLSNLTGIYTISYLFDQSFVMDVDNGNTNNQTRVQLYRSNSTNAQKWTYNSSNGTITGIGNKCLDSGSGTNRDYLRINDCHGGWNQQWNITADYTIRQRNSSTSGNPLCINIAGNNGQPANNPKSNSLSLVLGDCLSNINCNNYWTYGGGIGYDPNSVSDYCRGVSNSGGSSGGNGSGVSGYGGNGSESGQNTNPNQNQPTYSDDEEPFDDTLLQKVSQTKQGSVAISEYQLNESYKNDWSAMVVNASQNSINEIQSITSGISSCQLGDLVCYATNSSFQSASYNLANVVWSLIKGLGVGIAIGSIWELAGIIIKSFGKIGTVIWSLIQLFSITGVIFALGGDAIKVFLNSSLADRAYMVGTIIGAVIGGILVKNNTDSILETLQLIVSKASTIKTSLYNIVSSVKTIPETNIALQVNQSGSQAVASGSQIVTAIESGTYSKIRPYLQNQNLVDELATTILAKVKIDGVRAGDVLRGKSGGSRQIPSHWGNPTPLSKGAGWKFINPNNVAEEIRIYYPSGGNYPRPNGYFRWLKNKSYLDVNGNIPSPANYNPDQIQMLTHIELSPI